MHHSFTSRPDATPRRAARARTRRAAARGPLHAFLAGLALALGPTAGVQAAGEVSSLQVSERQGTPFLYTSNGTDYVWGIGREQLLDGFTSDEGTFSYELIADRVELRGDDATDGAGDDRCSVFAERVGPTSTPVNPSYPDDGSGSGACDIASILRSRVVNRGALDLFTNGAAPDVEDVERVDYLFDSGVLAPLTSEGLAHAGHVVSEKRGNNRLQIAAVLSLDVLGRPASYGPLVRVDAHGCTDPALCYGITDLRHEYAFFGTRGTAPDGYPLEGERSVESVTMAFVSSERLGLDAGQRYFGFSLFADDVRTDAHDLLDPATFPDDTEDAHIIPLDSADVYGGASGWFVDESLNNGSGRLFLDEDGDGVPGDDEAGIGDVEVRLHRDTDGNGLFDPERDEPFGSATDSDRSGLFVFPGLPDGGYFVVVRENDPELPAGLSLAPGTNPQPLVIAGGDVDSLFFAFVGEGGTGAGGTDAGGDDAGATDAGGDDAGATDAGATDAGATDAGGDDAGVTDAGGDDAGATDAGGDDAGTTDAGGDDAGATDAGGDDAGMTDAGGDDAGATDAGGDDAGMTDAGGDDAGTTDAGGDDAGMTDAGGDDAGTTDAGGDDAGTTDAGGDDAGVTDPDPDASLDDTVTRAERDRFPVLQNTPTRLDVLDNDSDAAGGGLTIIGFGDPANGMAEIVTGDDGGQQILYTPDSDFFGDDSFVYEIRDAAGFETSGTVTAEVFRGSDINDNGIDDFIECECTDLTLETGVHGSGIGRASFVLFALLVGAGLSRRRRDAVGTEGGR